MGAAAAFLPVLDRYRGMLDSVWGLRQYSVLVRVNTWAGGTLPGAQGASKTPVDTPLLVDGKRPNVEQLSQRDILASGGLYQDQDLKVGPLTPPFPGGGTELAAFEPPVTGSGTEVLFKVTGPAYPGGAWFKRVGAEVIRGNFHFHLILRKTAEQDG